MAELKHKINLKAMQFISVQIFLSGTKLSIFYTRCYALVADFKRFAAMRRQVLNAPYLPLALK